MTEQAKFWKQHPSLVKELQDMTIDDLTDIATDQVAGLSQSEAHDIEIVLDMIPSITIDVTCETDSEEVIQESDFVTMYAWVSLHRKNTLISCLHQKRSISRMIS